MPLGLCEPEERRERTEPPAGDGAAATGDGALPDLIANASVWWLPAGLPENHGQGAD